MGRGEENVPGGFSLLEVVVALILLQLGLLAVAGMALVGQRTLNRGDAVLRSTLEGVRLGDSVLKGGEGEGGRREEPFGWLEWERVEGGEGSVRVRALTADGDDTLAILRIWPPAPESTPEPAGGGQVP